MYVLTYSKRYQVQRVVSRDQILRHARGQGNISFPCSADHEQDWQPYPVDPYSAIYVMTIHSGTLLRGQGNINGFPCSADHEQDWQPYPVDPYSAICDDLDMCVCVFFPSILDIKFVGRTSRGHTGGRSHRIFNPPSFCGACLAFCREKDSAIPFPRRP